MSPTSGPSDRPGGPGGVDDDLDEDAGDGVAGSDDRSPRGDDFEDDLDLAELDDVRDKVELRNRYYGLLQELRVVAPGALVLVSFLFTAPFAERFAELDRLGRGIFGLATLSALLAVICLLSPAAFHRFGRRTARAQRLRWSIRLTIAGMAFLAVALVSTLWCVARFVYGTIPALLVAVPVCLALPTLWLVLPMTVGSDHRRPALDGDRDDGGATGDA